MDPFLDHSRALLLGGALGDAYGAPLEFVGPPDVRTRPVDTRRLQWTDDTQMTVAVGHALHDVAPRFHEDRFGHAVGRRFVAWRHHPLTPSLAPGTTCLTGARAYEATGDWRTSGVPTSDGCGAVMRVGAVPIALRGVELLDAARVQAVVTHGHANAVEASIAMCVLLRLVVVAGRLDRGMVHGTIASLDTLALGGTVARSLRDALAQPATGWLDEAAVWPGDGGWRSGSALGLAVAAALRHPTDVVAAIELGARIAGDSDSVAALAGSLVGAAVGTAGLPPWTAGLPDHDALVALSDDLADDFYRERHAAPSVRDSVTDPIRVDFAGGIGMTFAPGKSGISVLSGCLWKRDLRADLRLVREGWGADVLVSLIEEHELVNRGIATLPQEAAAAGLFLRRLPIVDHDVPALADAQALVAEILAHDAAGRRVVVHCMGGLGRTGTIVACALVARGMSPSDAIAAVRAARPGAIETPPQEAFVRAFTPR